MNRRDFLRNSSAAGALTALPSKSVWHEAFPKALWNKACKWAPDLDGDIPKILSDWFQIEPNMAERMFRRMLSENILVPNDVPSGVSVSSKKFASQNSIDLSKQARFRSKIPEIDSAPVNPDPVIDSYDQVSEDSPDSPSENNQSED